MDDAPPTPPPPEDLPEAPLAEPSATAPLPPPLPPAVTPPEAKRHFAHFEFLGEEREYFRIWIVNTLLTLLTCGVFSAWAKVRKRRYLRGSTRLQGHAFHYTARPERILIGNILVATLFLAYSFFGSVYPLVRVGAIAVGVILLPWIVVRSLSFNAHHTLHRGMRLRFRSGLTEAFVVYLFLPLLIPLSLGFYYPAWQRRKQDFITANHRYGDAFFTFHGSTGRFYSATLVGGLILFLGASALGFATTTYVLSHDGQQPPQWYTLGGTVLLYGSAFYTSRHFIFPRLFNHVWNHTQLDEHRFHAHLSSGRWLAVQWTNLLAILCTAGLALPWATIRNNRLILSSLSLELDSADALDRIDTMGDIRGSAVGDSAAEFIGVDFGL